jgi:negative regulator of flagellin synthesis FlgM
MKIVDLQQRPSITQQVNQSDPSQQPDKPRAAGDGKERSAASDKVELSTQSREMHRAHEVLQMTPDVRAEKVNAIKQRIEEGQYRVDSQAVAEKMIRESLLDLIE